MQLTTNAINKTTLDKLRELQDEGEPDIVQEFIEIYLSQTPSLLMRLRAGLSVNNLTEVQHAAHTIKGSSFFIGAENVVAVSAELEERSGCGRFDGLEELVRRLESEFETVQEVFNEMVLVPCA